MKRTLLALTLMTLALSSCGPHISDRERWDEAARLEIERTRRYFENVTNLEEGSAGYGLVLDRFSDRGMSSIAATGFALGGYPVYVEEGLMEKEKAEETAERTIDTLLRIQADPSASYGGCLSHFVHVNSGARFAASEVSTIDTALAVSGALVAGEYFRGRVKEKAEVFWRNVDFNAFKVSPDMKEYISMGVKDPAASPVEQIGKWDRYAEQLCIYLLGAGNPEPEHRIGGKFYKGMLKDRGTYAGHECIHSWFGSIFTYQYSHAFFDFRDYVDGKGVDWFDNSVEASLASYAFSQDKQYRNLYRTYGEKSWGLTACDTPMGYSGHLGALPRSYGWNERDLEIGGTIAPAGAIGSVIFTPELSLSALEHYQSLSRLSDDDFGLRDAYNLDWCGHEWFDTDYVSIDKGISLLMLGNYRHDNFLAELGINNPYIQEGLAENSFVRKDGGNDDGH